MKFVTTLVLPLVAFLFCSTTASAEQADKKAVLVTGATSGIGRNIAESLARNGFFVYAGARKKQDMDELNALENIEAVRLDVTVQEDVDSAVMQIQAAGRGLYGVVNNAGVLAAGPLTEMDVDQVRWQFEVNVFGVHRVTNAFRPLLVKSAGRIVNIGSIAGNIGIKYLGAYSMTKHAMEAYTDSLASEMALLGVGVSIVQPGDFSSNIWNEAIAQGETGGLVQQSSPFKTDISQWIARVAAMKTKQPDAVSVAVRHALSAEVPRRRYLVVPDAAEAEWVIGSAVTRLAEMNTDQDHAFTASQLADMLEASMNELAD